MIGQSGKKKSFVLIMFLLLTSMILAGWTQSDPLVSKGWIDQYIDKKFDPLAKKADEQQKLIDKLAKKNIVLYIGKKEALVNGQKVMMDTAPALIKGYTMLPMRFIGQNLAINIKWDNKNKIVSCSKKGKKIILPINGQKATIDGKEYALSSPPVLLSGRVLVPARLIAEGFDCHVDWNNKEKKINIY
ncbi:MAG: copper amine oxidase N-terminal domain-containing protein [Clostridiales bacterium]